MPQPIEDLAGVSYQERQRLTRSDLLLIPACSLFAVVGVLMFRGGERWAAAVVALAGGVLLLRGVGLASRRVMLRVDQAGIALSMSPPWPPRTAVVPWSHIVAVILWRQVTGHHTMRYIGLERRDGSPPLPSSAQGALLRRLIPLFTPGNVGLQAAIDSRPVSGWSVDRERLADVIDRLAPHVRIHDQW